MEYVHGFIVAGYRSFGRTEQVVGPFRKVNLFVGQNNSGKSNILRLVAKCLGYYLQQGEAIEPDLHEYHGRVGNGSIMFRIGLPAEHQVFKAFCSQVPNRSEALSKVLDTEIFTCGELVYLPVKPINQRSYSAVDWLRERIQQVSLEENGLWKRLAICWLPSGHPTPGLHDLAASFLEYLWINLNQFYKLPTQIVFIPQNRQIKQQYDVPNSFVTNWDGSQAVDQLARLQNPGNDTMLSAEIDGLRLKFDGILEFFRDVVDNPSAKLQVPYERNTILVEMDGRVSTLESLGTGLHQVIVLAIAATYADKAIVCIEEPEMNMHPTLQRRLMKYLQTKTDNQYFITSHSAALIDSNDETAIFHVTHDGRQTAVEAVTTTSQRHSVCQDLGFRASDLLQANAVIWVEGPSDRIYLKKLISVCSESESLVEGSHYTFAFYGGSIRAHYALENEWEQASEIMHEELVNLLELLPLNRNAIMVADSDLKSTDDQVRDAHKLRLETEFSRYSHGFYWQTSGRTIENYIGPDVIARCRKEIHPRSRFHSSHDHFTNMVEIVPKSGKTRSADKVAIAKRVCSQTNPFDESTNVFELGRRLILAIKKWNGMSVPAGDSAVDSTTTET